MSKLSKKLALPLKILLCWLVFALAVYDGGVAAAGLWTQALIVTIPGALFLYLVIEL